MLTLGHVFVQFMIVWQRYNENGSRKRSKRFEVASSRESITQRYACIKAAGPKYLSLFHQYEGHEVEQQAQRIHS